MAGPLPHPAVSCSRAPPANPRAVIRVGVAADSAPDNKGGRAGERAGYGLNVIGLGAGLFARKIDREGRALAGHAFNGQVAAVVVDDVLNDGETESGSTRRARARLVDPVESFG